MNYSVFGRRFFPAIFPKGKKDRLLQWVVFFSWQSHSEWSTFLTILTVLQFLLSLRSSIFTSSKKLNGAKGPLEYFRLWDFFEKKITKGSILQFFWYFPTEWMLKNPKGSPFQFFWHCETFFIFFFIKGSQFTNTLTFWSPFAIFEP